MINALSAYTNALRGTKQPARNMKRRHFLIARPNSKSWTDISPPKGCRIRKGSRRS